jgi:hypothetical protein
MRIGNRGVLHSEDVVASKKIRNASTMSSGPQMNSDKPKNRFLQIMTFSSRIRSETRWFL